MCREDIFAGNRKQDSSRKSAGEAEIPERGMLMSRGQEDRTAGGCAVW